MSPCHGGGHHLNSWYPLQFGNMMGNDRDMRWGWCQAGISKTGLLVEEARGWPLDISETQGAVKGWKVMSENCYFRAGGKRLITTWHQSLKADKMLQQWSRRHLPDILFVLFFFSALWFQVGRKRRKKREGEMTHLSILRQLLQFLQKGCTALKRGWTFSNKDTFDFSVAFGVVHGKKKPSCLQHCILSKCCSLNTKADIQCRSETPSCLSMAWSDWLLCSLRQILFVGWGLKVLLALVAVRAGALWITWLATLTECWSL